LSQQFKTFEAYSTVLQRYLKSLVLVLISETRKSKRCGYNWWL